MKRILLIGDANSYFRIDYAKNIASEDVCLDILSFTECSEENEKYYNKIIQCVRNRRGMLGTVLLYIDFFKTLVELPCYDAIHIHSVKTIEGLFAHFLKKRCNVLICTLYGSDIYRAGNTTRYFLKSLFKNTDFITAATNSIKNDFCNIFGRKYEKKTKVIPFGMTQLDYIKTAKQNIKSIKQELCLPEDQMIVTIGYNATKEQHHLELFKMISQNDALSKAYYVIPLSYGDKVYKNRVIDAFNKSGISGKCFTEFWPIQFVCKLRVISNIMIQIQDTDAFSASMNEYLYAGNSIITGSWLPYHEIEQYIFTVDSVNEIPSLLANMIQNYDKYKNKSCGAVEFLDENYSWGAVKDRWIDLYR